VISNHKKKKSDYTYYADVKKCIKSMSISFKKTLQTIRFSGVKPSRKGVPYVVINALVTLVLLLLLSHFSESVVDVDWFDVAVEGMNVLLHVLLFLLIAFIPLSFNKKASLLFGAFFTQTGNIFEVMDELYEIPEGWWVYAVDSFLFAGLLLLIIGFAQLIGFVYQQSTTDPLTKAFNRRFFEISLTKQLARMERESTTSTLINIDLDNFKQINDTLGHAMGDKVLVIVSKVLQDSVRGGDIVCRSGGEEFEVLLHNTKADQAMQFLERVRAEFIEKKPAELSSLTASIGLTEIKVGDTLESARLRADTAMYQAKRNGKDAVVVA